MRFIFESVLLEYKKEIEKQFFDLFTNGDEEAGKKLLDTFDKSKQLLLNNGISNNIQKWISDAKKDPSKVEELKNILYNLSTRQNKVDKDFDVTKKNVPGKYKELWKVNGQTLYRIDDVTASMALGVNTGWCTTGRYGHYGDPNFVPSKKNAEKHFYDHENMQGRGIGKLYYLVDDETGYGIYAWHFQADGTGKYSRYNKFDPKDSCIESGEIPQDKLGEIAYNDFMYNINYYLENRPEFIIEGGTLLAYNGKGGNVVIPNGVKSISRWAFRKDSVPMSITIPGSVKYIGESNFVGCTGITSVTICNGVTSIGDYAFDGCEGLKSVTIPKSVTSIGNRAFAGCTSLTEISLENGISINKIDDSTFVDCASLRSITLPNSVTSIGENAFWGCSSLTEITIPDSVTSIGEYAFAGCVSLENIEVSDNVKFGTSAFWGCKNLADKDGFIIIGGTLLGYFGSGKDIAIPDKVTEISSRAFYKCGNITSVDFMNVEIIGARAFFNCTNLTDVDLKNVVEIGEEAFCGCTSLTEITIPDSVTTIGDGAFYGCLLLLNANIGTGVTYIANYLFLRCVSLLSVSLPDSLKEIGGEAFYECYKLKSIAIPYGTWRVGNSAFGCCYSLSDVTIPNSVTTIGRNAFIHCKELNRIKIPNGVKTIKSKTFFECNALSSVYIPSSVNCIEEGAFDYSSATDVYYGGTEEDLESIDIHRYNYALYDANMHFNSYINESHRSKRKGNRDEIHI